MNVAEALLKWTEEIENCVGRPDDDNVSHAGINATIQEMRALADELTARKLPDGVAAGARRETAVSDDNAYATPTDADIYRARRMLDEKIQWENSDACRIDIWIIEPVTGKHAVVSTAVVPELLPRLTEPSFVSDVIRPMLQMLQDKLTGRAAQT